MGHNLPRELWTELAGQIAELMKRAEVSTNPTCHSLPTAVTFRSCTMACASATERASQSSLVTPSPAWSSPKASRPGTPPTSHVDPGGHSRAGQSVVNIDAIITDTERVQAVALGGEILLLC